MTTNSPPSTRWGYTDPKSDSGKSYIVTTGLMPMKLAQMIDTTVPTARLMAAAPELLQALKDVIDMASSRRILSSGNSGVIVHHAMKVIAEIEGRS
jgi:hypothetical protein